MYMGCKRIIITFQWICTAVFLFYFSVKIIVETSDRNENYFQCFQERMLFFFYLSQTSLLISGPSLM